MGSQRAFGLGYLDQKALPDWLRDEDFEYFVREFQRKGFAGGLQWYVVPDVNHTLTRHLVGERAIVKQPSLFVGGTLDMVVQSFGGPVAIKKALNKVCTQLYDAAFLEGKGHWVQQEAPDVVNRHLTRFFTSDQVRKLYKEARPRFRISRL